VPHSKPSSSCSSSFLASATGWPTKFFGEHAFPHEPTLDSSLKKQFPISIPKFAKFATMPSASLVRTDPIRLDLGSSLTAGNLEDSALAATIHFSARPSAAVPPAGAPSANPPLLFLAHLGTDSVTLCSDPALPAVFRSREKFLRNLLLTHRSLPLPHLLSQPQKTTLQKSGALLSNGLRAHSSCFSLDRLSSIFFSEDHPTPKTTTKSAPPRLSKPTTPAGAPPFANFHSSARKTMPPPCPSSHPPSPSINPPSAGGTADKIFLPMP